MVLLLKTNVKIVENTEENVFLTEYECKHIKIEVNWVNNNGWTSLGPITDTSKLALNLLEVLIAFGLERKLVGRNWN